MSDIIIYSYLIDDNFYSSFSFSESISVKGYLKELEHKLNQELSDGKEYGTKMLKDIHCVYLKGNKLDEHTLLKNYLRYLANIPLIITKDPTKLIDNTLAPINIDDYTNLELYKKSSDGYLFKAIDKKTGKTILIRNFNNLCDNYYELYTYKVASTLNHDGIVKILGFRYPLSDQEKTKTKLLKTQIIDKNKKVEVDLTKFIIIQEFMENGDIEESVKKYLESKGKNNGKMNPTIRSKIIYGVASIMKYAHEKGIIHDDLNIENIFFDKNLEPKIFGFENEKLMYKIVDCMTRCIITPLIRAPEKLKNEEYGLPGDVFLFAFLIYKMFSNKIEFSDKKPFRTKHQFYMNIRNGIRPKRPENIPDSYWDLIQRCWKQDPADRPTFQAIVNELKDDKYAINEFGMKTNLGEFHEYQKRIDACGTSNSKTGSNDLENQNKQLKTELDKLKRILFPPEKKIDKNTKNYFIDENDEKNHQVLSKIGEGATSITYKVFDVLHKQIMCKKILKFVDNSEKSFKVMQNSIKEFEVLCSLNHPSICKAIGINTSEQINDSNINTKNGHEKQEMTTIALFLEFEDYSLTEILDKMNNTLKTKIIIEIAHAMNYIHKKGLIHRDLKIDNIRLNSIFEAKIIDFGLVRIHEILSENYSFISESLTKGVGTLAYMSPEMLNEENYDYKTDVYSFGVVLHFIFVGSLPKQILKDKTAGKPVKLPTQSESISKFCIELISKCLSYKPSDRPSFEKILQMIRSNSYELASFVDLSIVTRRDQELELFKEFSK